MIDIQEGYLPVFITKLCFCKLKVNFIINKGCVASALFAGIMVVWCITATAQLLLSYWSDTAFAVRNQC
jgi:hypothetical protein